MDGDKSPADEMREAVAEAIWDANPGVQTMKGPDGVPLGPISWATAIEQNWVAVEWHRKMADAVAVFIADAIAAVRDDERDEARARSLLD